MKQFSSVSVIRKIMADLDCTCALVYPQLKVAGWPS